MYITYEAIYFVLNSYGNKLHRPFGREMKQRIDHRRWTEIQAIAKQKPEKRLSTNNFNLHGSMANLFLDLFSGWEALMNES